MVGQPWTASVCHLALKDSYLRSQGMKGLDTQALVVETKVFIIKYWIKLNSTIGINSHYPTGKQSDLKLLLRVSQNEPE